LQQPRQIPLTRKWAREALSSGVGEFRDAIYFKLTFISHHSDGFERSSVMRVAGFVRYTVGLKAAVHRCWKIAGQNQQQERKGELALAAERVGLSQTPL
jgi:hypothetical protein